LAELFVACPECGEEYRIDQEYCVRCGCHIPVKQLMDRIEAAGKEYRYEEVLQVADQGEEDFPGEGKFAKQIAEAKQAIAEMKRLKKALQSVKNEGEELGVYKKLLELYPNSEEYEAAVRKLEGEERRLHELVESAVKNYAYRELKRICEEGLQRFPQRGQRFQEGKTIAEKAIEETIELKQQLEKAKDDSTRIQLYEGLTKLYLNNTGYRKKKQQLENEEQQLIDRIRKAKDSYQYRLMTGNCAEGIKRFPKRSQEFEKDKRYAEEQLKQTEWREGQLKLAKNHSVRIDVYCELLKLYPNKKEYQDKKAQLEQEEEHLMTQIHEAEKNYDYEQMLRLSEKGFKLFPAREGRFGPKRNKASEIV